MAAVSGNEAVVRFRRGRRTGINSGCLILRRLDLRQTQVFCRHLCPTWKSARVWKNSQGDATLHPMYRMGASTSNRLRVWLALLIFSAAVLMPTLSQCLAYARAPDTLGAICSASVASSGAEGHSSKRGESLKSQAHCPYCLQQEHSPVLPVQSLVGMVPSSLGTQGVPSLFLFATHTLHVWSPVAARAPPALA